MPTTLAVDLTDLDTFVQGVPHEQFDLLRREAPIYFHPEADQAGFWCITRYDDLHQISQTHQVFSSEWGITLLRVVVIRYGVIAANMGGKVKTVLQSVAIGLYLLPYTQTIEWLYTVAWYLMLLTVAVTVVTGVEYLIKAGQLVAASKKQK